jgi:hypothetical protein
LPDGVTGNTSDSESEESRFDPWSGNTKNPVFKPDFLFCVVYVSLKDDGTEDDAKLIIKARIPCCNKENKPE